MVHAEGGVVEPDNGTGGVARAPLGVDIDCEVWGKTGTVGDGGVGLEGREMGDGADMYVDGLGRRMAKDLSEPEDDRRQKREGLERWQQT